MKKLIIAAALSVALAGCASKPTDLLDEDALYNSAQEFIDKKNYSLAIQQLEQISDLYPFGRYGVRVQLDLLYAYYQQGEYTKAVVLADRFVRLNPDHSQVDYAYYMRGIGTYRLSLRGNSFLNGNQPEARDPTLAQRAFAYLEDFVTLYPSSHYTSDARFRMLQIRDRLARHHLVVADFYLRRNAWLAAVNRANEVVQQFNGTAAVGDALAVMATAYGEMGMSDLKTDVVRVLKANFPDHVSLNKGKFQPLI